jgi:hypothetical protein
MNAVSEIVPREQAADRPIGWEKRRAIAYPLLIALALLLVVPSNLGQPLLHQDFQIQWVWADQFTAELARGNLYPRWLPLSNAGLGSSTFYYYPPLAFYACALFGLLGLPTYWSIIATFSAAFAASGIACWHWLRERTNHPLVGAAFFAAAPYHVFDYTVRGALAESVGIALIPLIVIGLTRIAERRGGVVFTALAYGALIGTHLPLALLTSLFLIAPFAVLHRRSLARFALAIASGIALSAIYLVPALALTRFHDATQLYHAPFLTTAYYSIYAGNWHDPVVLGIFMIMAAIVVICARSALTRRDGWAIYAIALCVVVSGVVPFLWSLPLLADVQFPFRALPLAEFAVACVVARVPLKDGWPSLLIAVPMIFAPLLSAPPASTAPTLETLRALHPDAYAFVPPGVVAPGLSEAEQAKVDISIARIPPPQVPGMVVEPVFYFPSWSCGVPEPRTQLLMHRPGCNPQIVRTPPERLGAAISAIAGLLVLLAWSAAVLGTRRRRR